jgi:PAS domain S-box-containing protein
MLPNEARGRISSIVLGAVALAGTLLLVAGRLRPETLPLLPVLLLFLPAVFFLVRGRFVLRSSLLLLLLGVLLLGRLAISRIESTGEAARARAYAELERAVGAQADSLSRWAAAIAEDEMVGARLAEDSGRREEEALFGALDVWGRRFAKGPLGEGTAFEIEREEKREPIAWWGEVPDLLDPGRRGGVRMVNDPLRVHLVVEVPVRVEGRRTPAGLVRVMRPVGRNPDLAEGVGREVPFARLVRESVGGTVRFFARGGEGERVLRGPDGSEIGSARVLLPSARERVRGAQERSALGAALLLLLFWASWLPWVGGRPRPVRSEDDGSLRSLALRVPIAAILLLRVLLLVFDLPARLGGGAGTTGPEEFSSPILLGAWKSPADATITGLVLFLILLSARERAAAWARSRSGGRRVRPLPLLAILALLTAATAAFGALVREACLSTTLALFDGPNPLGPPPVLLVELALLLAAAGYLFLVDALFVLASVYGRLVPRAPGRLGFPSRVLIGAAFAALVLGLGRLDARGTPPFVLLPAIAVSTGFLLLYLLRGRGWRVWSGFGFVFAVAVALEPRLGAGKEEVAQLRLEEKALRFAEPRDEWKRFLLEETLRSLENDSVLLEKLSRHSLPPMEREAFLAWVRSGLSRYDYSVELRILDRQGAVVSRFALDMPPESPVRAAFVFRDVRSSGEMRIYEDRRRFRGESMEVYTGAVPLMRAGDLVGAVMISIPYFYENLEYAAKLPPASYEMFRNLRTLERTLVRQTEALQVFLYRDGETVLSSSDRFPAETRLDGELLDAIERSGSAWGRIRVDGKHHDAFFTEWNDPEREGVLAFALPRASAVDRALSLIDIVLASFFFALAGLAVLAAALLSPRARRMQGGLRFETTFRDRLVLAFLLVSLLPALLLGFAGRRMAASRLREAGETAARASLQAVRYALERDAIREAEEVARSTLVRRRVLGVEEGEEPFDLELSLKRFAIFSPEGRLILQNGKVGPPNARAFGEVRDRRTPATAFDLAEGLSLDALVGITLEGFEERLEGILLLSRSIDEEWSAALGERVGTDISFYEGGKIVSSTRYELYQSGILSPRLPAPVYAALDLRGEEVRFGRESIAGTPYLVGYGALHDFDGRPVGTVAVPLLFQERETERDLERAYAAITYLTFLVLAVAVLAAETMGERIARPIRDLSRGMERISAGDLEQAVSVRAGGEIGRLVRSFNRMAEELKRSRDALTERTRYIETVLGSVGTGVIAFDREGRIASANRAAGEILAVPVGDLMGSRLDLVAGGRLEPLHRIVEGLDPRKGPVHEEEAELPRGGGTVTLRIVATAIADAEGRDLGKVIVFEDLTDLIRSKKLLAWGEMARQVAHEIKNPLTPMKLSVQHLKRAFHDAHPRFGELLDESADLIIEEIDTLQRIAAEFSTFARMPRREIRSVPASPLILETLRLYEDALRESRLAIDVPADLPSLLVDREEIRRLLINLLDNAVQATGGGGTIRVSARVASGSPRNDEGWKLWEATSEETIPGRVLAIRVLDDGPGVPEEARGKLFEPNFSTKTDGTGLGLAICRAIAADYGGVLAIGSTPGKGTLAVVALPLPPAV